METFGIGQCQYVGDIKRFVKDSLLESDTPNDPELARKLMIQKGRELGLEPVK